MADTPRPVPLGHVELNRVHDLVTLARSGAFRALIHEGRKRGCDFHCGCDGGLSARRPQAAVNAADPLSEAERRRRIAELSAELARLAWPEA